MKKADSRRDAETRHTKHNRSENRTKEYYLFFYIFIITIVIIIMSRDRTETLESVGSSVGGLRERTNTAGSVRSVQSNDADDDSTFFRVSMSPPKQATAATRTKRWSGVSSSGTRVSFHDSTAGYSSSKTQRQIRQTVEWIQRQRVPAPLYRQGRRLWQSIAPKSTASAATTTTPTSSTIMDVQEDGVYWVEGMDRVVFGTSSAAEVVRIAGVQPPRYLWYMLSGACCDVIQLCMDVLLHTQIEDASVCWAVTFFLSVVFRHSFHRYLVFGDYVGGYKASLARMYGGYSIIIVLSTLFNIFMTRVATFSHYVAWILTLLWSTSWALAL